jgi:hypothetical protein
MGTSRSAWQVAAVALACACTGAQAAGGHHAVDDATLLSRGECEAETWASRAAGGERLLHAGVNCRVGPVELGGAAEHTRADDASATEWDLEVKWAHRLVEGFSVGLDLQPRWRAHQSPRYEATRFAALATWKLAPEWALHANAGRDFVRAGRDLPNGGVAAEWTPIPRWSFVAERYLDAETHFLRAGARWEAGRQWSVDLSYARRQSGPVPSFWTLGFTIDLDDE